MLRWIFSALVMANSLLIATIPATANDAVLKIVVLGDSLSAGYGLAPGEGYPARLQAALDARGHTVAIIDAGVSGDTSSGGVARFEWSVPADADAIIVELGGNDALRGIDPAITRQALGGIISQAKARNQMVLLAGMLAPPNMGDDYADRFNAVYPALADAHDVALYPFFLDGVAGEPELLQPDGIHPTAEGVAIMVEKTLPAVEALIGQLRSR